MGVRGEDESGSVSVRVSSVKEDGVVDGKMCIIGRRVGEKNE